MEPPLHLFDPTIWRPVQFYISQFICAKEMSVFHSVSKKTSQLRTFFLLGDNHPSDLARQSGQMLQRLSLSQVDCFVLHDPSLPCIKPDFKQIILSNLAYNHSCLQYNKPISPMCKTVYSIQTPMRVVLQFCFFHPQISEVRYELPEMVLPPTVFGYPPRNLETICFSFKSVIDLTQLPQLRSPFLKKLIFSKRWGSSVILPQLEQHLEIWWGWCALPSLHVVEINGCGRHLARIFFRFFSALSKYQKLRLYINGPFFSEKVCSGSPDLVQPNGCSLQQLSLASKVISDPLRTFLVDNGWKVNDEWLEFVPH